MDEDGTVRVCHDLPSRVPAAGSDGLCDSVEFPLEDTGSDVRSVKV